MKKTFARDEILDWLSIWFVKNTNVSEEEIEECSSKSYFELGLIDSLKFISFIPDIEGHFNIQFSNDEFQDRKFSTITGLADIIFTKVNQ
ncbi:MAG: phosphopantetheine-binding protein [Lentisphaerae bacterium]|nr:phosphopantetheine-binding protein [Lentisphaerota bacterium]